MLEFIKKMLGGGSDAAIKKLEKIAQQVEALDEPYRRLSDEELRGKTAEFKARLEKGETLDDLLPEAFAAIREADARVLGERPYHVQILGGIVLHQGRIAEMKTGEGKTLMATLPAYLNALTGKGVHIVTVNDYLARRDSEWMGKAHRFMGLSVGLIVHDMEPAERRADVYKRQHEYYEPEELVGKTAIAIVNLPPRKMMGIDSEGMLISAVHEADGQERLNLLMVDDRIPAGAKLY